MSRSYWLYILSSNTGTLYIGMTNNITRRLYEHQNNLIKGFTSKYAVHNLIYYEEFSDPLVAIEAEKRIKKWSRKKKLDLVKSINPYMVDLSEEF